MQRRIVGLKPRSNISCKVAFTQRWKDKEVLIIYNMRTSSRCMNIFCMAPCNIPFFFLLTNVSEKWDLMHLFLLVSMTAKLLQSQILVRGRHSRRFMKTEKYRSPKGSATGYFCYDAEDKVSAEGDINIVKLTLYLLSRYICVAPELEDYNRLADQFTSV